MNRRIAFMVILLSAIIVTGCGRRRTVYVHEQRPSRYGPGHVCTRDCHDHYHNGSRLVVVDRHRHGPNCGHRWNGRRWVVSPRSVVRSGRHVRTAHVCTRDCNHHYHDGSKLVVLQKGHRHGPGCGHRWDGHRWVRAKRKAVIRR